MATTPEYYTLYHFFRERFVIPARRLAYNVVRWALIIFILASVANFIFSYFFVTPKMRALQAENEAAVARYEMLEQRIDESLTTLSEVRERDHSVYRSIFSADTLKVDGIYTAYAPERYASVGYGRYAPLMVGTRERLDALGRQIYLQSLSLDALEKLALDKDLMAEVVPAIMPIDRKRVTNIGSFGVRTHPVTRQVKMHEGMDFAGATGTPIYATGTGLVEVPHGTTGYGNQVFINHGFGYKTRYAHLSKVLVHPGQLVKRGEKIGELGNTGLSSGPHLHYEVIYRGVPVNPVNYISRDMNEEEYRSLIESAKPTTFEID